ncbi:MAG: radical SAM protein [Halanaerobium sp.]|nr:radical SAM protein [Halanaerobium sp.]
MKIKLIAPAWRDRLWQGVTTLFPPLNLALIAALTPKEHQVTISDESIEEIDFSEPVDLVGITAMTAVAPRAYQIGDRFRDQGVKVVIGGIHASACPAEAGEHADAVVVGEAEGNWPRLLEDLEKGRLKPVYYQEERPSLIGLPIPRRDLYKEGAYFMSNTVQTTRGCPYSCSFCAVTNFFGRSYRTRPVSEVIAEVKSLPEGNIVFVDDNIIANRSYAKELFSALIPLKKTWISQGSLHIAEDDELLELAVASGCRGLFVGIESLSPRSIYKIGKNFNRVRDYEGQLRKIQKAGIGVEGAFIFGFDEDDPAVFKRTVDFAIKNKLACAQFGILTPFPGTPFYQQIDDRGLIFDRDWANYTISRPVFHTRLLNIPDLESGFRWAWKKFYSLPSIMQRIKPWRKSAPLLWTINIAFRKYVNNL